MSSPPLKFRGYAIKSAQTWDEFEVMDFKPKEFGDFDVEIKISHCGVCGTDVTTAQSGIFSFCLVIASRNWFAKFSSRMGAYNLPFKLGDRAGVGAQVFACLECRVCKSGNENYCPKAMVHTYNERYPNGELAYGGYSTGIRAHEQFVFHIPDGIEDAIAAPMLCGGITVFSPLRNAGVKPGSRVAVVGIGGLGHFGILFASAMGAEVTAISHNDKKKADALNMGASNFVIADHKGKWAKDYSFYFDVIISTRSDADLSIPTFLRTLAVRGQFVSVGLPHANDPWKDVLFC